MTHTLNVPVITFQNLNRMEKAEEDAIKWFSTNKLLCDPEKTKKIILSLKIKS